MQLLCREEIKRSIRKMIPRKIAVGYVGSGWPLYIQAPKKLECFVVSPRLGNGHGCDGKNVRPPPFARIPYVPMRI